MTLWIGPGVDMPKLRTEHGHVHYDTAPDPEELKHSQAHSYSEDHGVDPVHADRLAPAA